MLGAEVRQHTQAVKGQLLVRERFSWLQDSEHAGEDSSISQQHEEVCAVFQLSQYIER